MQRHGNAWAVIKVNELLVGFDREYYVEPNTLLCTSAGVTAVLVPGADDEEISRPIGVEVVVCSARVYLIQN